MYGNFFEHTETEARSILVEAGVLLGKAVLPFCDHSGQQYAEMPQYVWLMQGEMVFWEYMLGAISSEGMRKHEYVTPAVSF